MAEESPVVTALKQAAVTMILAILGYLGDSLTTTVAPPKVATSRRKTSVDDSSASSGSS